jgi:hypothetical protein
MSLAFEVKKFFSGTLNLKFTEKEINIKLFIFTTLEKYLPVCVKQIFPVILKPFPSRNGQNVVTPEQCCGTVTIYYGSGSGSGSDF